MKIISVDILFIELGILLRKVFIQFIGMLVVMFISVLLLLLVYWESGVVLEKLFVVVYMRLLEICVGQVKNRNVCFVSVGLRKLCLVLLKIFLVIIMLKEIFSVVCYSGSVGGIISVKRIEVMKKFLLILCLCIIVNSIFQKLLMIKMVRQIGRKNIVFRVIMFSQLVLVLKFIFNYWVMLQCQLLVIVCCSCLVLYSLCSVGMVCSLMLYMFQNIVGNMVNYMRIIICFRLMVLCMCVVLWVIWFGVQKMVVVVLYSG